MQFSCKHPPYPFAWRAGKGLTFLFGSFGFRIQKMHLRPDHNWQVKEVPPKDMVVSLGMKEKSSIHRTEPGCLTRRADVHIRMPRLR